MKLANLAAAAIVVAIPVTALADLSGNPLLCALARKVRIAKGFGAGRQR